MELISQREKANRKEVKFKTMINAFEELNYKKLDPSTVQLWRKFLYKYPEDYFIRVVELAGELKWFPKVAEIKERFYEYELQEASKRIKLPEPKQDDYHKKIARKWMAQIKTIIRYGGMLREDFDNRLLGKLYEPEKLKELLNRNLRDGVKPPIEKFNVWNLKRQK
jgi:hypothetical protein